MAPQVTTVLVFAGLAVLAAAVRPAVRRALVNGARCLGRYPDLWRVPAWFTLGYAAFQGAATLLLAARLREPLAVSDRHPLPSLVELLAAEAGPAAERTATLFNAFVATFPLSAWFALLFVLNAGGLLGELARALRKRFGAGRGTLAVLLLVGAALASILRPAVYLLLPELAPLTPWYAPAAVMLIGAAFDLVLGVYFLTYLMLMTHAWLRGLHFERPNLRLLAMRRTGFVLKWSAVLVAAVLLFVVAPIYAGMLWDRDADAARFVTWFGRPAVTALALLCLPVAAILAFHNESLRAAWRDGIHLLFTRGWDVGPFLAVAYAASLALGLADAAGRHAVGAETWAGLGVRLAAALIEAGLAGWLIAAWVCLYKESPARRKEIPF